MIFEECENTSTTDLEWALEQWMNLENTIKLFFFLITYSTVTLNEL